MDQNLSLYKVFYTVANTGNISKAAAELYISQPAISKSILKLEQNLEVTLFSRNSEGYISQRKERFSMTMCRRPFIPFSLEKCSLRKSMNWASDIYALVYPPPSANTYFWII